MSEQAKEFVEFFGGDTLAVKISHAIMRETNFTKLDAFLFMADSMDPEKFKMLIWDMRNVGQLSQDRIFQALAVRKQAKEN